jgi:hypothetical protein
MAPLRSSTRHPQQHIDHIDHHVNPNLFIDPMLGTPLAIYIEKDVPDKDTLVDLILVSSVIPGTLG